MNTTLEDILSQIPDKQFRWKATTSLKWKKDLFSFFIDKKTKNALEIGTNQGWTSFLLSFFCERVYTVEYSEHNYICAQQHCASRTNINFILGDAYKDDTYSTVTTSIDLCIIDCIHTYQAVKEDITRCLKYRGTNKVMYLVFDDYSHPQSPGVRLAIDEFIHNNKNVTLVEKIGHDHGHKINRNDGTSFELIGPEGLIVEYTYDD